MVAAPLLSRILSYPADGDNTRSNQAPSLIMPQRPYRIDARGACGGIKRGED